MFNVDDKVKLISDDCDDHLANPVWGGSQGKVEGIIYKISNNVIWVQWDNGRKNTYICKHLELILERYKPLDDLMKFIEETLVI